MIDNCNLVYVDGVANAFNDNGEKSKLYEEALKYTEGNQEEAVKIWASTQSEEFLSEVGEENPSLQTVLRFLNNRVEKPQTLSMEELKEVSLMMSDMGISDLGEFTEKMNGMFQPNGFYEVDSKKLMKSGMFSVEDITEMNHVAVKNFLEKLNYFNVHKDFNLKVAPKKTKIQLRNTTAKKTPIGSYPLVSEQELVEYLVDKADDLSTPSIMRAIGNSPFAQILDDKKALKAVTGMLEGKTKVNKMFFDGENFTSENIDTFVTLRNTLLANADPIELEADVEFLESISPFVWDNKQKEIKGILKEVERTAIKYNIDIVGLSELSNDRETVLSLLSSLDDMLLIPTVENIKEFARKKDEKISPNKPYTVIQLKDNYKDYNIVKIDTNLSDDVMFQKGFLRIGNNGLYHRIQRAEIAEMYDVVYEMVQDNSLVIPSNFFPKEMNIKDPINRDVVMGGIVNYINSRDTGLDTLMVEEVSLMQTIFAHEKIKKNVPQDIVTDEEYLKTGFVSDFYNYILQEKEKNTDLYNKVLRHFTVTDADITLDALETPDVSGIKFEQELRDYSRLKKDGQIKELEKGESKNEDLIVLNNPKRVNEEQGTNYVVGEDGYVLTENNPKKYITVGGKLHRKLFDKSNGTLYKEVIIPKNTLYFDNNLNFDFNRQEAESAHKKLSKSLKKSTPKTAEELSKNVNIPNTLMPIQFQIVRKEDNAIRRNNGNPLTLAPNGQPSILYKSYKDLGYTDQEAERLVAQVYSDEFISWFGDWINNPESASKVVDENGQPLLTWHNSKNRFNEFKKTKGKRTSLAGVAEVESSGFFFAKDKKFATAYGDVVYPSFLNIRNVFDISQGDGRQQDLYKKVVGRDMVSDMPFGIETAWEYFDGDEFDISNDIIKNNFDGVNIYEKSPENSDLYSDVFITFNPNQIKSATENVGTFSTDSNDIRYQIIGEQGASRMVEYKQQLDRAKELEKEGKTPAQIELETGWYKYKGDWRTIPKEVVESFQIKDKTVNKELTLKQVLGDDSTIFSFYPEISGAKVVFLGENYKNNAFEEAKKQTFGFVDEKTGTIYINMATTNPSTGDRVAVEEDEQVRTLEQAVKNLIQESAQKGSKETVEEIINKLKQLGLSSEVFLLNTTQLLEKLKELEGETKQFIIDGNDNQIGKKAFLKSEVKPLMDNESELDLKDFVDFEELIKITPTINYENAKIKFKKDENRASEISAELQFSGSKVDSITFYFREADLQSSEDKLRREVAVLISHETQHIYDRGNFRNSGTNIDRVSKARQQGFGDVSTRIKKTLDSRGNEIFSENFGVDFGLYLAYEGEYRARINALQEQGIQEELFEAFEPKIEENYLWNTEEDFKSNNPQYYYDLAVNWYANTINPAKSGIEFMKNERGLVKGFVVNNQVYLNTDLMDETTPFHEFQHLFLNWSKEARPDIYNRGLILIEEELKKGDKSEIKDIFDFVKQTQPTLTGNALLEEYLTEFIGRYSKRMMDEQKAKSPLMQFLQDFWASVKEMLGITEMTPAQVANLTLEEYAKASVVTLSKGENFVGDNGEANFNRWKGENELVTGSEIQNVKTGQPIVVKGYHGTTNEFYEFDASVKGNIEGHLGKVNYFTSDYQDASQNYLAEGADITGRIDRRQDELEDTLRYDYQSSEEGLDFQRIIEDFNITDEEVENLYPSGKPEFIQAEEISRFLAEKEIKGETEQILDVFIKLNNPVVLGNGATWFETLDIDEVYMQEATEEIAEEYGITEDEAKEEYEYEIRDRAVEKQGDDNKIVSALEQALDDNGYDQSQVFEILGDNYYEAEVDLNKLEESIRKSELYDNYDGELASSQVIADFFKNLGFDGIILTDVFQRFSGMRLSPSTSHIHVFDEYNNQIKLADGTNTTFNPKTPDIRFQKIVYDARVEARAEMFQMINDFGIVINNLYPKSKENEIKDKFDECRI